MTHGARKAYQAGCRCLPCRSANAAYQNCYRAKLRDGRPVLGKKQNGHETAIKLRYLIGEGYSPGVLMSLIGLRRRTFYEHIHSYPVTLRVAFKVQRFWRQQQIEGEAE